MTIQNRNLKRKATLYKISERAIRLAFDRQVSKRTRPV